MEQALKSQPQLRLVKVADGARDNWEFLAKELPPGEEVVDFYHAAEHLRRAFGQVYGEASPKAQASFEEYRHLLLKAEDGVGKVIRTLAYHHGRKRRCKALKQELEYFRRNRARMDYARLRAQNLPIGSGVVEAACKTLVTQRMKRSGSALEHRRRSGHPHLPRAGSERALRWRVEAGLRRIPPRRSPSPKTSFPLMHFGWRQCESYTQTIGCKLHLMLVDSVCSRLFNLSNT
ncbi:MAG: hypothetical protein MZW92_15385, partial [Comamonadaceae bacterium]|nr:hypothetical protein [Comamonadaceae bacterium]